LPVVLYQFIVISTDPLLSGWNSQNLTPAPPLWDTVVSLAPLILLAPFALGLLAHERKGPRLMIVWLLAGLVLLYLPWGLQRRFMMGLYVPLSALAAMLLANRLTNTQRFWSLGVLLFLLVLPTNLVILQAARYGIQTHDSKLYLTRDEVEALAWIEANTPTHALILAAPDTGLLIPAYTGRRVIYGHPFETVNADDQKIQVERFFQGAPLPNANAFFNLIDYVFYGPREREIGKNDLLNGLRVVYQNPGVILYSTR